MSQNDHVWGMRMPAELHEKLTAKARGEARTPAAVMRMLAELYIDAQPGEPLYLPGASRPGSQSD